MRPRISLFLVALLAASSAPALFAAGDTLNRVVLRVNDEILTQRDFERRKSVELSRVLADPAMDPSTRQERLAMVPRQIAKLSFDEMLIRSRGQQLGLTVSEAQVDEVVRDLREEQGIKTEAQLVQALAASGMTLEEFRNRWRRDLMANQIIGREVWGQIEVGEEELRAYYRNHLSEFQLAEERWLKEVIVLESSGLGDDQLRHLAATVRGELAAADDFAAVIQSYRDQGQTTGIIDLDWLRKTDLDGTLADVAFGLEEEEVSQPIKARGGYHICFVEEVRQASVRPFDEVQGQILQRERNKRFQKEFRAYMAKLEKTAYVQENLPADAVGFRSLGDSYEEDTEFDFFAPASSPEEPQPADDTTSDASAGASAGPR